MPCKNEANALQELFKNLPKQIDEVIVVDNNSNDQTAKIAAGFGAKIMYEPRSTKSGIGYGYALQKGIDKAKGNIIICMDGDGSYPAKEILSLVNFLINKKLDFISCNRLSFENPKKMSSIRSFGVRILNFFILILYGYKIEDSLSGMLVFRHEVYDQLRPTEGGWNFSLEFKLKAITDPRYKFVEKQISYHDRIFDVSKQNLLRTGLEHSIYILSFRLSTIRRKKFALNLTFLNKN